jgi:hypothetical protein
MLPNLAADAVAADPAMLKDAAHALSEVDADALDVDEQVDHALLSTMVDRALFELTEIRSHEWDPLRHNPGSLLHALLARPFAPAEVRLESRGSRGRPTPGHARASLRTCHGSTPRRRSGSSPAPPR